MKHTEAMIKALIVDGTERNRQTVSFYDKTSSAFSFKHSWFYLLLKPYGARLDKKRHFNMLAQCFTKCASEGEVRIDRK